MLPAVSCTLSLGVIDSQLQIYSSFNVGQGTLTRS